MSRLDEFYDIREAAERPPFPETGSLQASLVDMQNVSFCETPLYQEQQWRANREMCDLGLLEFEKKFVRIAKERYGVPLFCHTARRTAVEQERLHREGRSKVLDGPHMHGLAVDIIHGTRAWSLSRSQWSILGHIGKEVMKSINPKISLEWGGDWRYYDPAHWEVSEWRKRK